MSNTRYICTVNGQGYLVASPEQATELFGTYDHIEPVPQANTVQQITRRQGLLALFDARGITESDIQAVIDAIPDEAVRYKAGVEFAAHHWQIDNPIVASFALALNIEPQELEELFVYASTL